jgi:hypothetical protein
MMRKRWGCTKERSPEDAPFFSLRGTCAKGVKPHISVAVENKGTKVWSKISVFDSGNDEEHA